MTSVVPPWAFGAPMWMKNSDAGCPTLAASLFLPLGWDRHEPVFAAFDRAASTTKSKWALAPAVYFHAHPSAYAYNLPSPIELDIHLQLLLRRRQAVEFAILSPRPLSRL